MQRGTPHQIVRRDYQGNAPRSETHLSALWRYRWEKNTRRLHDTSSRGTAHVFFLWKRWNPVSRPFSTPASDSGLPNQSESTTKHCLRRGESHCGTADPSKLFVESTRVPSETTFRGVLGRCNFLRKFSRAQRNGISFALQLSS